MSENSKLIHGQSPAAQDIHERPSVAPSVDIYENEAEYLVVADLPGVAEPDVKIDLQRGELTLYATRRIEEQGNSLSWELDPVDFRRVFKLPDVIDESKIRAELEHGVLSVHLPKSDDVRPRTITVTSA